MSIYFIPGKLGPGAPDIPAGNDRRIQDLVTVQDDLARTQPDRLNLLYGQNVIEYGASPQPPADLGETSAFPVNELAAITPGEEAVGIELPGADLLPAQDVGFSRPVSILEVAEVVDGALKTERSGPTLADPTNSEPATLGSGSGEYPTISQCRVPEILLPVIKNVAIKMFDYLARPGMVDESIKPDQILAMIKMTIEENLQAAGFTDLEPATRTLDTIEIPKIHQDGQDEDFGATPVPHEQKGGIFEYLDSVNSDRGANIAHK